MVKYKLIYFNLRGIAELSRLVFKVAGVEFEDKRIERKDWPNLKQGMPMGKMPVLEIDGVPFTQSYAIARYLAREFGLFGSSNLEELRINELLEVTSEIWDRHLVIVYYEKDTTKKVELAKKFAEDSLPTYMNFLEMRLKENNNGNGFYIGDKLSFGDLVVYDIMTFVDGYLKLFDVESKLSSRKFLVPFIQRVEATPSIAEWLKVRPVTEY